LAGGGHGSVSAVHRELEVLGARVGAVRWLYRRGEAMRRAPPLLLDPTAHGQRSA
jgi:hypothetical protein